MFGETEYDPSQQFSSMPMEEQLEALGRAVDADKSKLTCKKVQPQEVTTGNGAYVSHLFFQLITGKSSLIE